MGTRRALGISAFAQAITFILSFVSVIVISRVLTPAEIGVYSIAASMLGIAHVFRDFGVSQYLVQAQQVGTKEFRAAFSLTLYFSWSIALLLFLIRSPAASFYGHSGVADVLLLLAFNFVLLPLGTPNLAMLRRELRFQAIAGVQIANALTSTAVTIFTALEDQSYLSMAWGAIAGHVCNVVALNVVRRGQIFMLPTVSGLREVLRFGSVSSLASLVTSIGDSSPDLIFGRTLGFSAVAYHSRALGVRDMFLGQVYRLVNGVHFPSFAERVRAGDDPAELYRTATVYLTAVTVPAMALLAFLAHPLILLFFGSQWTPAAPLASLLCVFAILTAPYALANLSLIAVGRVGPVLRVQITTQGTRIAILMTSVWLPLEHVVPLLGIAYLVEAIGYHMVLRKAFRLTMRSLLAPLGTSFLLGIFVIAGPLAVRLVLGDERAAGINLLAMVAALGSAGAAGWLLGVRLLRHPIGDDIARMTSWLRRPGRRS